MQRVIRLSWFCVSALLGVLITVTPAAAQFDRAQISGTVKDAQGGVVPGATVVATNMQMQTQIARNTVTDQSGFFTIPNLAPGKYDVTAQLEGFKKAVRSGVTLDAASETGLRKTIESKDIEQLSFTGRNPIGVVGLKPGVIGGSFNNYGFSDLGNGGFNINGSRSDENNIAIASCSSSAPRSGSTSTRETRETSPSRRRRCARVISVSCWHRACFSAPRRSSGIQPPGSRFPATSFPRNG
jgi:hypothetical protein